MSKTAIVAVLAALTLSGAAHAGDRHRDRAFQATGPQPIAELLKVGGGTATGTVGRVAANWFVLNDGQTEIDVTNHDVLPEGIQTGAPITVVGAVRHGAIQASRIIRDDGTAFGGDAFQERGRRHHDDD
ncbi:hypothetical protein FZ983_33695 [Azospirillum sp. B21]|uniref:cytochrome c maturation protein CcmE domain-containing protein n=1 Tax=Azospirillum sp. B21 TaxID=2607496 RepID=UPI0011EF3BB3|nr:cytochrome c maturation protein CcmE [Azospirillum sp. B21]KAA0571055.1 hypothetical protein FZ983_33695 [Azospirillum sp. B21]